MRTRATFLILALAGAALDLGTKAWAKAAYLAHGEREIRVLDGFFSIAWTTNRGIVFGRFAEFPWAGPVFLVISILAVPAIAAIYFSVKKPRGILTGSLGLILAGTLGNMVDRLAFGHVRDFLKFFYVDAAGDPHIWPLFNLADSFICVGVALLSIDILFFDTTKKRAARAAAASAGVAPVVEVAGADPTEPMPRVDLPEPHHAQEADGPIPPSQS